MSYRGSMGIEPPASALPSECGRFSWTLVDPRGKRVVIDTHGSTYSDSRAEVEALYEGCELIDWAEIL